MNTSAWNKKVPLNTTNAYQNSFITFCVECAWKWVRSYLKNMQ